MKTFKEKFKEELENYNIKLSNQNIQDFDFYANQLIENNKLFNLTSHQDEETIYYKGFLDALSIAPLIKTKNKTLIDIGTGAGFPGLPIAIVFPNLNVHLLESNLKKVIFLEKMVKELDLKNVVCIRERAENYKPTNLYDYVVSRAVAKMPLLVEFGYPLTSLGGEIIAYKARNLDNEMINSEAVLDKYKLEYKVVDAHLLDTEHKFAIVKKTSNISMKKRPMAKIKNSPLW